MGNMLDTVKPKSDQMNFEDFLGRDSIVIKITKVTTDGPIDQPVSIFYEGESLKPYKPNKSMRRVLIHCWGIEKDVYIGRSLRLFGNPKVKWAGAEAGGIQISEFSNIEKAMTINLTVSRGKKEKFTVNPLKISALDELKIQGEISAKKGMEAFTVWGKSLTAEQKTSLTDYIKELMVIAKNFDAKGN